MVIPKELVCPPAHNDIRLHDDGVGTVHDPIGGVALPAAQCAVCGAPCLEINPPVGRLAALPIHTNGGMVCVHPHAKRHRTGAAPCGNHNLTSPQVQLLVERFPGCKRVWCDSHTHPPKLQQSPTLTPCIRLAHIKDQIVVRLAPQIDANIPIAQRHRTVEITAGTQPVDVVRGEILRIARIDHGQQGGCGSRAIKSIGKHDAVNPGV